MFPSLFDIFSPASRSIPLCIHRRALDVPAGPAAPPRRVPPRVLSLLVRLPEGEVAWVLLQLAQLLLLGRVTRRLLVGVTPGELPVVRVARDAEVDVAAGRIRVAALDQLLDQREDLRDRLGGLRLTVGAAEPELGRVLHVPVARAFRELGAGA